MAVLDSLTKNRPAGLLASLQEKALPSLIEMARWKAIHAYASFLLIARIAGWDENDIHPAWDRGEREIIIAKAARSH
jgi:hypothetical protein